MMHPYGFNYGGYWLGPLIVALLVIASLILAIVALFGLRKGKLSTTAAALWALIIIIMPFLGAIAYFIVNPHEPTEG